MDVLGFTFHVFNINMHSAMHHPAFDVLSRSEASLSQSRKIA
jgi:hypothetical protein